MCLIANHIKIKKAKTDLICYKVLDKKTRFTPIQLKEFTGIPEENNFKVIAVWPWNKINRGFIHSFRTLDAAERFKFSIPKSNNINPEIFRAYIPKGTLYWEGVEEDYASRRVILK